MLLIYNDRTFFCSRLPIKFAKLLKFFLEGVRLRHSVLLVYNERSFSVIVFPSNSPNFQIYFWKGERFGGSALLVYNERIFSQPRHRGKELYMMGSLFRQILPSVAARNPT